MTKTEYYQKHKEVIDAKNKLWRNKNKDKYQQINRENVKKWRAELKKNNPEAYYSKKRKENAIYNFGRTREEIFALLGERCDLCGRVDKLEIHHRDGRGSKYKHQEKNNTTSNLQVLCRKCHRREDAKRINEERIGVWSIYYDKCVICGKTDSKHSSTGICDRCYQKTRRRYKREYWRKHYGKQGVDK